MKKEKVYVSDIPELLEEWDFEKNEKMGFYPDKFSSGSHRKAWWRCKKNHNWNAEIKSRFNGSRVCLTLGVRTDSWTDRSRKCLVTKIECLL